MAQQSIWYYTDLPEDVVDLIEKDLTENFDQQMGDSKLHGDALNKEKRNSQNAWIPTTHWVGGFMWHYIQRANRENFLYDLRCIDGESMQYTRYGEGQFYGWHNDAGLQTQYKPVSVSNRVTGEHTMQDFVNENCEMVRESLPKVGGDRRRKNIASPVTRLEQFFFFFLFLFLIYL